MLSKDLSALCRNPLDDAKMRACLDGIADALDRDARQGAFNGRMEAGTECWSPERVRPVMDRMCDAVRKACETSGRRVKTEICENALVLSRTTLEASGTSYNVRVKLIEAPLFIGECIYAAAQWSAYGIIEHQDGAVFLVSNEFAHQLTTTIRPYLKQL